MSQILVVDDEHAIRWSLQEDLKGRGHDVALAKIGFEALKSVQSDRPDLVLLDLFLPDVDGLKLLKEIKEFDERIQVIVMTGSGAVSSAVEAMKLGAFHYVEKPFDLEELNIVIQRALETQSLKKEVVSLRIKDQHHNIGQIIGSSQSVAEVLDVVRKVALSKATSVLIQGESGTGKGLIARAIHDYSPCSQGPFVDVNCTALPENLLESELFGYDKGAFTDAKKDKMGLFELADGGTLFLDEIGDISAVMQAKLLKAIEEKRFKRVGGVKDVHVDVRIIASTNKDLAQAVSEGSFREDLYYRLQVVPIVLPPLRERGKDVLLIAEYFMNIFNQELGLAVQGFHEKAKQSLLSYHWPGNIRELRNVIERAMILESSAWILPEHLWLEQKQNKAVSTEEPVLQDQSLDEFERDLLVGFLDKYDWNRNKVAEVLKINRATLYNKIKRYQLEKVSS